jgi:hypothetical protein
MSCGCTSKLENCPTLLKRGESALACKAEACARKQECCRSEGLGGFRKRDRFELKNGTLVFQDRGRCGSDCILFGGRTPSTHAISFDKDIYVDASTGFKYYVKRVSTNSRDPHDPETVPVFYLVDEQCDCDYHEESWDKRKHCDPCKKLDPPKGNTSVCELLH